VGTGNSIVQSNKIDWRKRHMATVVERKRKEGAEPRGRTPRLFVHERSRNTTLVIDTGEWTNAYREWGILVGEGVKEVVRVKLVELYGVSRIGKKRTSR